MGPQSLIFSSEFNNPVWIDINPESAGWTYSGLSVVEVNKADSHEFSTGSAEALILPLEGSLAVTWMHGSEHANTTLNGRDNVFSSATDFIYLPPRTRAEVKTASRALVAVCTAEVGLVDCPPPHHYPRSTAKVLVRGAGNCSRQVVNYTVDTGVRTARLLVCEAITPGGNWSSYPPHKHDTCADDERALEEIYFFLFRSDRQQQGRAFQRAYGTAERPLDLLANVQHGDVVLIPHGYHGPTATSPGYDLYGLNVMAGPALDQKWLATDDPQLHWVRATWDEQVIDQRLPMYG